jgi:hypothetical protein
MDNAIAYAMWRVASTAITANRGAPRDVGHELGDPGARGWSGTVVVPPVRII